MRDELTSTEQWLSALSDDGVGFKVWDSTIDLEVEQQYDVKPEKKRYALPGTQENQRRATSPPAQESVAEQQTTPASDDEPDLPVPPPALPGTPVRYAVFPHAPALPPVSPVAGAAIPVAANPTASPGQAASILPKVPSIADQFVLPESEAPLAPPPPPPPPPPRGAEQRPTQSGRFVSLVPPLPAPTPASAGATQESVPAPIVQETPEPQPETAAPVISEVVNPDASEVAPSVSVSEFPPVFLDESPVRFDATDQVQMPESIEEAPAESIEEILVETQSQVNFDSDKPVIAGRYQVVSQLGRGVMCTVFKVKDIESGGIYVLKLLPKEAWQEEALMSRFERESQIVCGLVHDNLIPFRSFGLTEDRQPYLLMDYLHGITLARAIRASDGLPLPRVVQVFDQLCQGLAAAHSRGILHRDIRPENIMFLSKKGDYNLKLVDFGIAKVISEGVDPLDQLKATGEIAGDPTYMSPEECLGKPVDVRSDIYTLGCVIYCAMTSHPPFFGGSYQEVLTSQLEETIPPPSKQRRSICSAQKAGWVTVADLEYIVMRCLEKNPSDRYQTVDEILGDIEKLRQLVPLISQTPKSATGLRTTNIEKREPSRNAFEMLGALLYVLIAVVIVAGAAFYFFSLPAPNPAPAPIVDPRPTTLTPATGETIDTVPPVEGTVTVPSTSTPSATPTTNPTNPSNTPTTSGSPAVPSSTERTGSPDHAGGTNAPASGTTSAPQAPSHLPPAGFDPNN